MPDYKEIPDTNVAPFWPINTPLLRKYRDNANYVDRSQWLSGLNSASVNVTDGSGQDGAWQTVSTMEVLVPVTHESPLGSKLSLHLNVQVDNDANASASTTLVRITVFGTTGTAASAVVNPSSSNTVNVTRVVTASGATVTAGQLHTVLVEGNVTVTGSTGITTLTLDMDTSRYGELHAATV